jgi:two-component system, cell cycle sensor histidine kinase and response regulator CckA
MASEDARKAVQYDEQLLRSIFDHMLDAYFRADLDGRFTLVSPSAARLYGYDSTDDMIGLTSESLYAVPAERSAMIRQLLESGHLVDYVGQGRRKDGSTFWVSLNARLVRDDQGTVEGIEGYVRDITRRKQAEDALRSSEDRFQKAFHHSPDAININRLRDGLYVEVNSGFLALTGYEKHEVIGRSSLDLGIWADPGDRDRLVAALARDGEISNLEARFRAKDGAERTALMSASVITLDGEPHILSLTRDITERKRIEAEKVLLEARLQHAQKMESVGRLAGGVAHDFNNMLGVILGHVELALRDVDPSNPLHADLEEIQNAAERSADLTRQLLAFARKQTVTRKVLDLNEAIEATLSLLRRMIGESVHLAWRPAKEMWLVNLDPSQLDQVLANLCVNARDAIADIGTVTIETGTVAFDAPYCADHEGFLPGEYVQLAVSDDGCGMDQDTQAKLFEPFFTTKEVGKGTGLGLATVYGIVRQNGGFINVYSEPGHGTTFRIYLPRHAGQDWSDGRADSAAGPGRRGQETILLVEDEAAVLRLTRRMLVTQGYTVLAASTPGEAIALAAEHAGEIHLLMTDVVMPEMNGRDLAKNLLSRYPRLRRLFMSGYTANVIAHHGVLDAGVHFIQKPFSLADLTARVREALDEE